MLTLVLIIGNFGMAFAAPADFINAQVETSIEKTDNSFKVAADPRVRGLSENSVVRIIVELKSQPVVDYAVNKGVALSELSTREASSVEAKIKDEQKSVKNVIAQNAMFIVYHNDFQNVFNGFSATTSLKNAKAIEDLANVKNVTIAMEYERPKPLMHTSHEIIETYKAWGLSYKGEGMTVAILDTGVDPDHNDMKLITDPSLVELEQAEVESAISNKTVANGKWFSIKVPYGYNYADNNTQILDLGPEASNHGMHVAGTAAANGDPTKGGIQGVAPEAQVLAMKVFGNDPGMPSTYGDIYVRAIEDSVKLGADVINMSLGSTASFVLPESVDPARVAIKNAMATGVIVSVSAGNSNHIGDGLVNKNPYASNPDIGVVGAPSLNPETLSVASIENNKVMAEAVAYKDGEFAFVAAGQLMPKAVFGTQAVNYVFAGLGKPEELAAVEVTGKIALISRGELPFVDKILNAQAAGAIGVIIFNTEAGGEELISMQYPETGTIPAIFAGYTGGMALKALDTTADAWVKFPGTSILALNPNMGKMSAFTSWGVTPSLDFKPEITAPGGKIYSTFQNNRYGTLSGTSMAAPHVTGGTALVLQRIDKEFPELSLEERSKLAKNLLMSTADPLIDKGPYNSSYGLGNYISPRRGGAGVMDVYGATTSNAIVTSANPLDEGLSKVNLKEIGDLTTFEIIVENFGTTDITYELKGTVGTDMVMGGENLLETSGVYSAETISEARPWTGEFPIAYYNPNNDEINEITVPAKGSATIKVQIDLTNAVDWAYNAPLKDLMINGAFVEGFVTLSDKADLTPMLSIPYVGFYGDWDQAPILDDYSYSTTAKPFYGPRNVMAYLTGTTFNFLGINPTTGKLDDNFIVISTNPENPINHARGLFTFLRNAKEVNIDILDAEGNVIRQLARDTYVRKNFYDAGRGSTFTALDSWTWDGTIKNVPAEDGQYYYRVEAVLDYPGARPQTQIYPVKVDGTNPEITNIDYDKYDNVLISSATDNHMVLEYVLVNLDDDSVLMRNATGEFKINDLPIGSYNAALYVFDYVGNYDAELVGPIGETTIPYVNLESPGVLEAYTTNTLPVYGTITDDSPIQSVNITLNEVPVNVNYDSTDNSFSGQLENMTDGVKRLRLTATDRVGNSIDFERKFFVDATPAAIQVSESLSTNVAMEQENMEIPFTVTDNFPHIQVKVNGNILFTKEADYAYLKNEEVFPGALNEALVALVTLEPGENEFVIEAVDFAGNKTYQSIIVYRGDNVINITNPIANTVLSTNVVELNATISENAEHPIASIDATVNGITEVLYTATEAEGDTEASVAPGNVAHTFENVADGLHFVSVNATLKDGNTLSTKRKFFIDTEAPVLTLTGETLESIAVPYETETFNLTASITDNFPGLLVIMNNTVIHEDQIQWATVNAITPSNVLLNELVNLAVGENTFNISVLDSTGQTAAIQVVITRDSEPAFVPLQMNATASRTENVGYGRSTIINGSANAEADWNITVYNTRNEVVTSSDFTNTSEVALEWMPNDQIKLNGTFKAVVTATRGEEVLTDVVEFTVYNYPVKIQNVEVSKLNGNFNVRATVTNLSPEVQDMLLLIQVEDNKGKVMHIGFAEMEDLASGYTMKLGSGFVWNASKYKVKAFVWSGWSSLKPLAESFTIEVK